MVCALGAILYRRFDGHGICTDLKRRLNSNYEDLIAFAFFFKRAIFLTNRLY